MTAKELADRSEQGVTVVARRGTTVTALERRWGWFLVAPALGLVALLTVVPIAKALWSSLFLDSPLLPSQFLALGNYADVIGDAEFFDAWRSTLAFTALTVTITTLMGLGASALLSSALKGSWLLKPIALLPWTVPSVIAGVMWRWIFNGSWGPLNGILYMLGVIHDYVPWLDLAPSALIAVAIAQSWALLPLATIFLLAAMHGIPSEQYEAAKMDGANAIQSYWYITLANIRTPLLIVVLYLTLVGLTAYDIVYSMTSGGPGTATSLISYFAWSISFRQLNFGQGTALAVIIALVSLAFILAILRALPKGALAEDR